MTLDGFGNQVASGGSSSNPYMYAATSGYRNDGDAGLSHVGARYYDAQVGRFISRDTFLDQHPYLYCNHDPVNNTDPSGHSATQPSQGFGTIPGYPKYIPGVGWVDVSFDENGNETWSPHPIPDPSSGLGLIGGGKGKGKGGKGGTFDNLPGGRTGLPIGGKSGSVSGGGYIKGPGNILKGDPPDEIGGYVKIIH